MKLKQRVCALCGKGQGQGRSLVAITLLAQACRRLNVTSSASDYFDPDCARRAQGYVAAAEIVAKGKCPSCGGGLKHNLSLHGWWQCEQFGAEQFSKDATKPSCSFQTFTR